MKTLLFSLVLYLLGITGVLFFRPQLMFHKDGRWKEFGLEEGTMFPFWLFCIIWAIVSYVLARFIVGEAVVPLASAIMAAPMVNESVEEIPTLNQALGSRNRRNKPSGPATETMKPGYYRLNASALEKTGVPRYVYVGPEEPDD
jgi:hypothetical protein